VLEERIASLIFQVHELVERNYGASGVDRRTTWKWMRRRLFENSDDRLTPVERLAQ
jgi:hypothetical protein